MTSRQENQRDDEQSAHELLNLLAHAHAVLDARDHRNGTYVPPQMRDRHVPRHHEAWHQTTPNPTTERP